MERPVGVEAEEMRGDADYGRHGVRQPTFLLVRIAMRSTTDAVIAFPR